MDLTINKKYNIAYDKSKLGKGLLIRIYPLWLYIFRPIRENYIEINIGIFSLQFHFSIGRNRDIFL